MSVRVVHSVGSLAEASGGPSRVIPALAAAVSRAGGDVTLIAGDDGRPAVRRDDVTTRLVPVPGWRSYGETIAGSLGGGILHDHGIWSAANRAATGAARATGRPYVINPHGMLEPWAMAHHRLRKQVAWAAYQQRSLAGAAALVATAEPERATIRRRFPRVPIAVIPNGVDIPVLAPRAPAPARTVLFLSRLHPVKNLPGLLDAWALLAADPLLDAWRLHIVGPDEDGHAAVVRIKIAGLNLGARVTLEGAAANDAKAELFAASDLFVLPSFSENFGIVAAEALAHGVPVVASTGTPWSELAPRGCGWQSAPDPAALADALRAAMRLPPAVLAAMGAKGRDWVAEDFGWDAIGVRMLAVYEWLLHGGTRPDVVDV